MFWHLWFNRRAELSELRNVASLESDMDTLLHIKEILNSRARDFFKKEIVVFHPSKFDLETGENVMFNWWLELDKIAAGKRSPIIDFFQDDQTIMLLAEVPEVLVDSAEINYRNGILTVKLQQANPVIHSGLPRGYSTPVDGQECLSGENWEYSPADIFDETDRLVLVMDLPEAEEITLKVTLSGQGLLIIATGQGRKLHREVALPCFVEQVGQQNYHNGILTIELVKRGDSHA